MATTVADVMVATLKASGVRRVYGIPGDSLNGFTDALRRDGDDRLGARPARGGRGVRGGGGGGADRGAGGVRGQLRAGQPAPDQRAVRRQPQRGAGAGDRRADPAGGDRRRSTSRRPIRRSCSASAACTASWSACPSSCRGSWRSRCARRWQRGGVAVVVVPGEMFLADAAAARSRSPVRAASPVMRPDEESLAAAAQVLNAASRVTILAGAGCAGAHDQLIGLAEALKAPVVHAFRGKEFVEYDNPYDVGMTGLIGFSSGYRAMEHCDALVMLGTDFPYRPFYPERRAGDPGRRARRADRAPGAGAGPAGRHGQGHGRRAAAADRAQDRLGAPGPDDRALPAGPRPAGQARPGPAERLAAAPAVRRRHHRPARRRRRDVHRRRRHAVHLGRALPADERHPPADRLVQPRVHGQRAAARHRRPGQPARAGRSSRCPATAGSRCCSASSSRCASSIFRSRSWCSTTARWRSWSWR